MKTKTRSNVYLSMAALILTAALAVPAAAQQPVPFKGTFQGNDTDKPSPIPNTIVVATSGTGIGTHLGQFSFTQEVTVSLANVTDTGSAHLIAANGDSIDATIAGSGQPTGTPGVFKDRIERFRTLRFSRRMGETIPDRCTNMPEPITRD